MEAGIPTPQTPVTISFFQAEHPGPDAHIRLSPFHKQQHQRNRYMPRSWTGRFSQSGALRPQYSNPQGSTKTGSSTIFSRQPLMVYTGMEGRSLARTRYAITTFRMAGVAPHRTVHFRYAAVAPEVSLLTPRRFSNGC